jgi:hypothetical protein
MVLIQRRCQNSAAQAKAQRAKKLPGGAVVFTSDLPKFFSNGLDYENSVKDPNFHWSEPISLWVMRLCR